MEKKADSVSTLTATSGYDETDDNVVSFEDEDDAVRYAMMLEEDPYYEKEMEVVEVDDELAIKTCRHYNYKYTVITPNDIVIPPKNDNLQKN